MSLAVGDMLYGLGLSGCALVKQWNISRAAVGMTAIMSSSLWGNRMWMSLSLPENVHLQQHEGGSHPQKLNRRFLSQVRTPPQA